MKAKTKIRTGAPIGVMGTCAIIVTYHPDFSGLMVLLAALQPQVQGTVVVDNGSTIDLVALLCGTMAHLIPLGENHGVAAGFRQGRELPIIERIGHHVCGVALWPTVQRNAGAAA